MPTTIEITIGWTRSEVVNDQLVYSSFSDGYKPGASQHTETISVVLYGNGTTGLTAPAMTWEGVEQIAEAAFDATNNPDPTNPLSVAIRDAIVATGYRGQGAHYSLSVGDTVTVGEVMLACEDLGWSRVRTET